jgi:hypothetical protein
MGSFIDTPDKGLVYFDSDADLFDQQTRVRLATAAALPTCVKNGSSLVASSVGLLNSTGIDGVTTVAVGDLVLVKDQVAGANNGVYRVTSIGAAAGYWSMERAPGWNVKEQFKSGRTVVVCEGSANGDKIFQLTTNDTITMDSTSLTFTVLTTAAVVTVSKAFTYATVAALGAVASGSIDFDAALPAGAMVIAAGINVTAIFDNVTDTASATADLGIASGDTDAFVDGASLDAVAKVGSPAGVAMGTLVGAVTPSILVDPDVNCDTITKGSAVAYVSYILAF